MDEIPTPETQEAPEKTAPKKRSPRKTKTTKKSQRKPKAKSSEGKTRRQRIVRSFPASTFEEALFLGNAIQQFAAGARVRRITLFGNLGKSPDSSTSRALVTNSSKYGVTSGGYTADFLELTTEGRIVSSSEASHQDVLKTKFSLAIDRIEPFKALYEQYKGNKLPNPAVLRDFLVEEGYQEDQVKECVETFILNAKYLGLLKLIAGTERLLTIEHALEEMVPDTKSISIPINPISSVESSKSSSRNGIQGDWKHTCFYVTPIGSPDSEQRQHSDLFLNSIVEPALSEFDLKVIRADQIAQPGIITKQIIEHILYSRLVIADLSFHNPNVFYELSLRHACRLPVVQLIRANEKIPFDLDQFRTIQIDTSTIYSLVPQIETYKAEIANQVRRALSDPDAVDNPISLFFPGIKVHIP